MRRITTKTSCWALFTAACSIAGRQALGQAAKFVEVGAEKGLASFVSMTGDGHGPGAVFTDLNGDGFADVYMMNAFGGPNALFLNVPAEQHGGRRFHRAANDAGAGYRGEATGALAADYDNDGDVDLYLLNFDQPNVLYRNQQVETGQFGYVDVTASTRPTGEGAGQLGLGDAVHNGELLNESLTGAWGDPDRDGDLDLYVGNHFEYFASPGLEPGEKPGQRDVFYRNNGDGTFSDATLAVGAAGFETRTGASATARQNFSSTNAVIFADFNNDRWPDLLVTNKVGGSDDRDMLYINRGASAAGQWLGYATATYSMPHAFGQMSGGAMGVDVGDLDNDGDLDIYITDWSDPEAYPDGGANDLWINQLQETGRLDFVHSDQLPALYSWGTQIEDFDNNGWEDVHVATDVDAADFLYLNSAQGLSADRASVAGVNQVDNSRGDQSADYNRDGWVDLLVINPYDGPSVLYENRSDEVAPNNGFLSLKLVGDPSLPGNWHSTRDAIGARIVVSADLNGDGAIAANERMLREVVSGSSNAASTSSLDVEVGLGLASGAIVTILWPSGRTEALSLTANQFVVLKELLADHNGDGVVDGVDRGAWATSFGLTTTGNPSLGDSDQDGDVDGLDFLNWQRTVGASTLVQSTVASSNVVAVAARPSDLVPEPCGRSALILGLLVAAGFRGPKPLL